MVHFLKQEDIIALRHQVLRKNQPIESCYYEEDKMDGCFHLGIRSEHNDVVCIASFYPEKHPDITIDAGLSFRLRGMATQPSLQGKGLGSEVIRSAFEIIREKAANSSSSNAVLWCNARTSACGFYEKLGFHKSGDEFVIEPIGPHYVMAVEL